MKKELKTQTIYQVYVRNFSKEGTFKQVIEKLDYIKSLGTDILYLLPIHEIGIEGHKGSLGCPYSIKDYYSIAKELGTLDDFKELINETHNHGMKIMMDIVFNHTSRDSLLFKTHPEWFFKKDGKYTSKAGDWTDVYDMVHNKELDEYLSDNLVYWAKLGVDGFRFDVCSLIPMSFYKLARKKLNKVNRNIIFLGEAIEYNFTNFMRSQNYVADCDAELYQYFDLLYNYDSFPFLKDYIQLNKDIKEYKDYMYFEEALLPSNALRIRSFENHDQERLAKFLNKQQLRNLLAYSFFLKGTGFIYAGQETLNTNKPSLFDKDVISLDINDENKDYVEFVKLMIELKHNRKNKKLLTSSVIKNEKSDEELFIVDNVFEDQSHLLGIFNLSKTNSSLEFKEEKYFGKYKNLITNKTITIKEGYKVSEPLILRKIK